MKHADMTQKLTFGKHRGLTLAHVAQFDPTYLDWMQANNLCGPEVIRARDRGDYPKKKLPIGYAVVW